MSVTDLPFDLPEVDYEDYTNRQLLAVPLGVLLVALLVIGGYWAITGAPVDPGIEFTGGTEMRIAVDAPPDRAVERIQQAFEPNPVSIQTVTLQSGAAKQTYIVTFGPEADNLREQARSAGFEVLTTESTSASFGRTAQTQALGGIVVAFLGMSVLVFAMFRSFVPSVAVVASAFSDLVIPIALMDLLGIPLTLGTVAALLMIIGYSVDSDILLNNHVLRRSGGFYESAYRAMRTGVTMTLTSLSAMVVMTVVASLFGIGLLSSIGLVLVFGLTADLMNTYMLNMALLRWYKFERGGR